MQKYFPLALFIMFFTAFLSIQILVNHLKIFSASDDSKEEMIKHYERLFLDQKFNSIAKKDLELKKIKSPIVVLNFWATQCLPCLIEIKSLVELRDIFSEDDLKIVSVSSGELSRRENIEKIKRKFKINYPIVMDYDGKIFSLFQVMSVPFSIIYYKGKVFDTIKGAVNFSSEKMLEKLKHLLSHAH